MTIAFQTYKPTKNIPNSLVYEVIDGIPVYYNGYKDVLSGKKTLGDIMGYGEIQTFLVNLIRDYYNELFRKEYWIFAGESGVHLEKKSNMATDIAFYPKSVLSWKKAKNKYIEIPPEIVIEVDTKADPDILKKMNYYTGKTQRLLDFGVEQVIWVYSDYKKVTVANQNQTWLTINWSDEFTVLNHTTTIEKIMEEMTE